MKNSLAAAIIIFVTLLGLAAGYLGGTANSATGNSTTTITNVATQTQTSLTTTTVTTTSSTTSVSTTTATTTTTTTNVSTRNQTSLTTTTVTTTSSTTSVSTTTATTTVTKSVTATATQNRTHSESIVLAVEGYKGGRLGPDGKPHDTFIISNFSIHVGVYDVTIINYSIDPHTLTSNELGTNVVIPGAASEGVPSVTTFQLTATKPGVYRWLCLVPCDLDHNEWAMEPDADGQVGKIGFMGGFITVTS